MKNIVICNSEVSSQERLAEENFQQAVQAYVAGCNSLNFTDILVDLLVAQIELQKLNYRPDVIRVRSCFSEFGIYAKVVKVIGPYKLVEFKTGEYLVLENGYFLEFISKPEDFTKVIF